MANKSRQFYDAYVMRAVQINRAAEGEAARRATQLNKFHGQILRKVRNKYGILTARALRKLNEEISEEVIGYFENDLVPNVEKVFKRIVEKELNWHVGHLSEFAAVSDWRVPNSERVAARAAAKTYQGHTFAYWLRREGRQEARNAVSTLVNAYTGGLTLGETERALAGVLGRSTRDVKVIARSYLNHAAAEARNDMYEENEPYILGYGWVATLDARTTVEICGVRDGLRWDKNHKPIGHAYPWEAGPGRIHWQCRSVQVPIIEGMDFEIGRPSVGPGRNYERGDNITQRGRVRKNTKAAREKGIFKTENVGSKTNYEDWLFRQPKDFVADVLGSEAKATEFKSGRLKLGDFTKSITPISINRL